MPLVMNQKLQEVALLLLFHLKKLQSNQIERFSVQFKWVRSNDPSDSIQGMRRGNVKVHFQFIPRLQKKTGFK